MPPDQKLLTPLVEQNVKLEPATPMRMTVTERIQRSWSLLFGKDGSNLCPIQCNLGGVLAVGNLDKTKYRRVATGDITTAPDVDLGEVVDFVDWHSVISTQTKIWLEGGLVVNVHTIESYPSVMGYTFICVGRLIGKVRYIALGGISAGDVCSYSAYAVI